MTFLALLELIRMKQLVAVQSEQFGEIEVEMAPVTAASSKPPSEPGPDEPSPEFPPASPPADIVLPVVPDAPGTLPEANPLGSGTDNPQTA